MNDRKITDSELKEIVYKHKLWLNAKTGGERAKLNGLDFRNMELCEFDLRGANLEFSDFRFAYLFKIDLEWSNLNYVDFRFAELKRCNLRYANLINADFKESKLDTSSIRLIDSNCIYVQNYFK